MHIHSSIARISSGKVCCGHFCLVPEIIEILRTVAVCLEILDKSTHQFYKSDNITVLLSIYNFVKYFLRRSWPKFKSMLNQCFLKMFQQIAFVIIGRKRIDKISIMCGMQSYLVIHGLLVLFKLFFRISAVLAVLSYTEMFNICSPSILVYCKVRSIRLISMSLTGATYRTWYINPNICQLSACSLFWR